MSSSSLYLKILTPYGIIADLNAMTEVYFNSVEGMLGILPGHAAMMLALDTGVVICSDSSGLFTFYKVAGGLANVTAEGVTLLADVGEEAQNIDMDRALRAIERAESRLAAKGLENIDFNRAQESKKRATARLEAARMHREGRS